MRSDPLIAMTAKKEPMKANAVVVAKPKVDPLPEEELTSTILEIIRYQDGQPIYHPKR